MEKRKTTPIWRAANNFRLVGLDDELLAEWTGLEPATPGVTGRYSNQLNYHSADQPISLMRVPVRYPLLLNGKLEREKSLELSTYTLARYRSTN